MTTHEAIKIIEGKLSDDSFDHDDEENGDFPFIEALELGISALELQEKENQV